LAAFTDPPVELNEISLESTNEITEEPTKVPINEAPAADTNGKIDESTTKLAIESVDEAAFEPTNKSSNPAISAKTLEEQNNEADQFKFKSENSAESSADERSAIEKLEIEEVEPSHTPEPGEHISALQEPKVMEDNKDINSNESANSGNVEQTHEVENQKRIERLLEEPKPEVQSTEVPDLKASDTTEISHEEPKTEMANHIRHNDSWKVSHDDKQHSSNEKRPFSLNELRSQKLNSKARYFHQSGTQIKMDRIHSKKGSRAPRIK